MMFSVRAIILGSALLSLLGADCDDKQSAKVVSAEGIDCAHDDKLSLYDKEIIQKIDKVLSDSKVCLDITDASAALPENSTGNCAVEEVRFQPKAGHDWSKGQRILIVDAGMHRMAFTRYKKRILDFVDIDSNGYLTTDVTPLTMHRGRRIIFSEILGEEHPYIPARKLENTDRLQAIREKFPEWRSPGHGTPILQILAEHNPKSEFVIAQLPNLTFTPFKAYFCAPSESSFEKIESFYQRVAHSLLALIDKHEINFIQYAEDATLEAFTGQFDAACPGVPFQQKLEWIRRVQKAHFNYFEPLTSRKDVVLVQAGASSSYRLQPGDQSFLMDCTSLPNRLRVGFLNKMYTSVPREGANHFSLLSSDQRNARACIDLYINSGVNSPWNKDESNPDWQAAPHAIKFTRNGMSEEASMALTPSWASPVALSYLIYLKRSLPVETATEELLAHANNQGNGKVKDPAFFAQFEKCRFKDDPNVVPPSNVTRQNRELEL